MREGQDREGRKDGERGGWTRDERVGTVRHGRSGEHMGRTFCKALNRVSWVGTLRTK